jgi:hypothetical protein
MDAAANRDRAAFDLALRNLHDVHNTINRVMETMVGEESAFCCN